MLVRATGDDPRTDHGAGKYENLRDRQCDDRWMAYCIESLDQTQFEQKESTQQIADYKDMTEDCKDQLSNKQSSYQGLEGKRAASLGSGVSERSTADRRSISRRSCHRKHHQPDDSMSSPTKHSKLRSKMEGPREVRSEESAITSADSDKMRQLQSRM